MARYDNETVKIVKRLQNARLSLLQKLPFYALLLMHLRFAIDYTCETSYTDGTRIAFNPDYLNELDDAELEFVLMHEVLHAALGHPFRMQADYNTKIYDKACDIIVNSNILYSFDMDESKITIKNRGVAIHKTPDGREGYECTLEQVYDMLMKLAGSKAAGFSSKGRKGEKADDSASGAASSGLLEDGEGESEEKDGEGVDGACEGDDSGDGGDEGVEGGHGNSAEIKTGNKKIEKRKNVTEKELKRLIDSMKCEISANKGRLTVECEQALPEIDEFDDHSFWQGDDEINSMHNAWDNRIMVATDLIMEKEKAHKGFGGPPLCAQRRVKELREPEVDWRKLLHDFVHEEINDYSFAPPDRRMDDSPFFLPDFNEKDESVKNVWFLIDTSGSIGDEQISAAYSEIVSALEAFDNKLEGLLSFTEVFVSEPIPFCSIEELFAIKPVGGGGNDFGEIFRFMKRNMSDNLPSSIIIFTDGYDFYPDESEAMGVPVLWLLNNEEAAPPKWGRYARFKVNGSVSKVP